MIMLWIDNREKHIWEGRGMFVVQDDRCDSDTMGAMLINKIVEV
jgi:hypothetical protein